MTDVKRVSLYEEARLPASPAGPSMTKNVLLASVIGLVLPCAIILLVYMIDDRIKSADDVQRALKLSTLGDIPYRRDN
jgi:capsular polysaccharide biosynthesis protein